MFSFKDSIILKLLFVLELIEDLIILSLIITLVALVDQIKPPVEHTSILFFSKIILSASLELAEPKVKFITLDDSPLSSTLKVLFLIITF